MIDFALNPELESLQQRGRNFIREQIIPMEWDARQGVHGPNESLRLELVGNGRDRVRDGGMIWRARLAWERRLVAGELLL